MEGGSEFCRIGLHVRNTHLSAFDYTHDSQCLPYIKVAKAKVMRVRRRRSNDLHNQAKRGVCTNAGCAETLG